MFSILRKSLLYKDVSETIKPHDSDVEVELWNYDGKDVYRGTVDPEFVDQQLHVYWLYDDDSRRVGLAEHEANTPAVFEVLWVHDNPFSTLLQEPGWKCTGQTVWSRMTNEAYQDCLEDDFKTVFDRALSSGTLLVTPDLLMGHRKAYECPNCNKKSLSPLDCPEARAYSLEFSKFSLLFLDDNYIIYEPHPSSTLLPQPHDASVQEQQVLQEPLQSELTPPS